MLNKLFYPVVPKHHSKNECIKSAVSKYNCKAVDPLPTNTYTYPSNRKQIALTKKPTNTKDWFCFPSSQRSMYVFPVKTYFPNVVFSDMEHLFSLVV